jgi:hypothetical protein
MYNGYRSQGFLPLAINLGEDMETVVKYYARQYTYPFLRDEGDMAWNLYKINGSIPLNYVIDPAGMVVNSMEGYSPDSILAWISPYFTGVEETPRSQPIEFTAIGANPVIGHSAVRFSLPKATNVTLRVYSASGALVRTLVNGQTPSGANTVNWDLQDNAGRSVGAGMYLYELNAGSQVVHTKVSVLN